MDNLKSQLNLINMLKPNISSIKNEKDLLKLTKKTQKIQSLIKKMFPSLHGLLDIDIKNSRTSDIFLKKLNNIFTKKFKYDISLSETSSLFYKTYGYIIKILMAGNLSYLMYTISPTILYYLAIICTIVILYNSSRNNIPIKQVFENFKQSFKEFMKRNAPLKEERNFAWLPVLFILFTTLFTTSNKIILLGLYGVQIYYLAIMIYLICSLADEWIIRRGFKNNV